MDRTAKTPHGRQPERPRLRLVASNGEVVADAVTDSFPPEPEVAPTRFKTTNELLRCTTCGRPATVQRLDLVGRRATLRCGRCGSDWSTALESTGPAPVAPRRGLVFHRR